MGIGWQIPRIPRRSSRRFDRLLTNQSDLSGAVGGEIEQGGLYPSEQFPGKATRFDKTVGRRWISTAKVVDKLSFDCGQVMLSPGDVSPYE